MAEKPGFRHISSASADEQQMAQIREILFGEQNRRTEGDLKSLGERLDTLDRALRELLDSRITQLSEGFHRELEKQGLRHQASIDGLDNALRGLLRGLDEKIDLVDSDLQDAQHKLKQAIDDHATASVRRAQLADLLEQFAGQLRGGDET